MDDKPTTAAEYSSEQLSLVRSTCLYLATKLGDLLDDVVVVGGLVPSLLIDQQGLTTETQAHVGTTDLDIGLAVALLDEGRYQALTRRLRRAGFAPDVNQDGNLTRQRWTTDVAERITVDFLIPSSRPDDRPGTLRNIESDFAAVITPGLHLAFEDRESVQLAGRTIAGEAVARRIWICGPAAYVALKALAFKLRGENKDAYDLLYVLQNYSSGLEAVAARLQPLLEDPAMEEALSVLEADFLEHDGLGPRRVAEFLTDGPEDTIQADVVGWVSELIRRLRD